MAWMVYSRILVVQLPIVCSPADLVLVEYAVVDDQGDEIAVGVNVTVDLKVPPQSPSECAPSVSEGVRSSSPASHMALDAAGTYVKPV
eukprot:CAMPEP_0205960816 /NCGR_PEP_ID=MMETSP1459-20131121/63604_1 /ASSEMBLY_ACC=CAM_ASM_001120 /TAXON_ID=41880 /ORGANISM="Pycnococcus provasolii, Strain RCC931" /LENGTH=87 /DNA_ID=CAMNT_0053333505 /DNA_START=1015 /DNA_END=1279 /DNA_ORIENTATION=-